MQLPEGIYKMMQKSSLCLNMYKVRQKLSRYLRHQSRPGAHRDLQIRLGCLRLQSHKVCAPLATATLATSPTDHWSRS